MTTSPASEPLPERLIHDPQECEGSCTFRCSHLIVTPGAIDVFSAEMIVVCHVRLMAQAQAGKRLDFLQIFRRESDNRELWFMQDGPGIVTALLPEER